MNFLLLIFVIQALRLVWSMIYGSAAEMLSDSLIFMVIFFAVTAVANGSKKEK